jgi:SAM-dependent methyltransferase
LLRHLWKMLPKRTKVAIAGLAREEVDAHALADQEKVRDLELRRNQIESILQYEHGLPPPPKHLQVRVGGEYQNFIAHGYSLCGQLGGHLAAVTGRRLSEFYSILDFGCGCGRVTRPLKRLLAQDARIHGLDIDPEAIAWAAENYKGIAEFRVGPTAPPTPYADNTFDLIYGISVFTHLPEDMQFAWLDELRRITRPGGYLALSTHGEHHADWGDDAAARQKGFVYKVHQNVPGLPDFYQGACHTEEYIRREWGKYFEVLGLAYRGLDNWQDIVFLRKG